MQYKVIEGCSAETYQTLLEHGWRRFGRVFFRPICAACTACLSLRVDAEGFVPGRSRLRTWRRNQDLTVHLGRPTVTPDRMALFARYHAAQSQTKGWEPRPTTPEAYHRGFVEGFETFGYELTFHLGEKLLAVALLDRLPNAISAVYCYYDPDHARRGLGVNSVLHHVALARQQGIERVYLGYWVEENASLAYKAGYGPHELLVGRPETDAAAVWQAARG